MGSLITLRSDLSDTRTNISSTSNLRNQQASRFEDAQRLTNYLKTGNGALFLAKQLLLNTYENRVKGEDVIRNPLFNAIRKTAVQTTVLISQAGLAGLVNLSAKRILTTGNYVKPNYNPSREQIPATDLADTTFVDGKKSAIKSTQYPGKTIEGVGLTAERTAEIESIRHKPADPESIKQLEQQLIRPVEVSTTFNGQIIRTGTEAKSRAIRNIQSIKNRTTEGIEERIASGSKLTPGKSTLERSELVPTNPVYERPYVNVYNTKTSFTVDPNTNEYVASTINVAGTKEAIDIINITSESISGLEVEDIIPFKIVVYEPGKADGQYLLFRAFLNDLKDGYTGGWNSTTYIGRADPVYNYTSFNRQISFGFKIAAFTVNELVPLYRKLNKLAGTTAPSYSNTFMRGVLTQVTIGDWFKDLPGFFSSVSLDWQQQYPWEIDRGRPRSESTDKENVNPVVPHILDVSINFTPIHTFVPNSNANFINASTFETLPPPPSVLSNSSISNQSSSFLQNRELEAVLQGRDLDNSF